MGDSMKLPLCVLLVCSIAVPASASMLETNMLQYYSDQVFRPDSMTLCIVTSMGDTIFIRNTTIEEYPDSFSEYRLISYLPEQNYWALERLSYEWMDWLVVNGENGRMNTVISEPWLSPDGTRFYCAQGNLYIEYMENGIQIWRFDEDSIAQEFEDLDVSWEPNRTEWMSDSILYFEKIYYENGFSDHWTEPGWVIQLGDGTWITDNPESWQ